MNSMSSNQSVNVVDHDATFYNSKDGITLSGTLSIPESQKKPAVVILVAGTGPFDRDCTQVNGHKLFLTIAHYFTKLGATFPRNRHGHHTDNENR